MAARNRGGGIASPRSRRKPAATAAILKIIADSPANLPRALDAVAKSAAKLCDSAQVSVMIRDGGVLHPFSGFTPSVSQLQVESRGSVEIRSADPRAAPAIRYNFLGAEVRSDEDLLAVARQSGETVFHPTSTCRMGTDTASVVDSRLRVRGLQGLRVVDASVIAIAEKAADLIANPR